jgi:uncharacterized protein
MRVHRPIVGRTTCLTVLLLASSPALAAAVDGLYEAQVHVTGQEEPARSLGFASGLEDVLVKLSGDPTLVGDPAVAALGANAASLVRAFRYRDLMAGIPVHDEQGTRQRPFILTVDFDRTLVDDVLKSLGRVPWSAERPRLVVFAGVDYGTAHYLLASDGARGRDQRDAIAAAAWRYGMPMGLPNQSWLDEHGLSVESVGEEKLARLNALARTNGGDLAIAGTLTWTPKNLGWTASWRFAPAGITYEWSVAGVTFDQAFRSAMLGAAQILSGHGSPK